MGRRRLQTLCLRDGRQLRFLVDGPAHLLDDSNTLNSLPVIFAFHAMFLSGDSFLQHSPPTDYIVVCMNRPGYHGSSPVIIGKYSYQDFSKDVEELADHLGIVKFSVVGHSSGGPNALACASFLKSRVLSVAVMAGDPEYAQEKKKQEMNRNTKQETTEIHDNGDDPQTKTTQLKDDYEDNTSWTDWFLGWCLPNCMRFVPFIEVTNGLKNDFYLERQMYPFRTEDILQPAVVILGDQDTILPVKTAIKVQHRLTNSQLIMLEGVGHNQLLEDTILDMVFRKVIDLSSITLNSYMMNLADGAHPEVKQEAPKQAQEAPSTPLSTMGDVSTDKTATASSFSCSPCWKCKGNGKKYEKSTKSYTGKTCNVCNGVGNRPASQKSLKLSQSPGKIQSLRGYPDGHPLRVYFPDKFASPRAFHSIEDIPAHLLPQVGEVVGSLGCSDWRIYQLQNGNKLTVDDFVCAYVAAQEMLRRGWSPARDIQTSHKDTLLGGLSVEEAIERLSRNTKHSLFTHVDLGTGCGSVLMMVAWAFLGQIKSIGVEAQEVSFACLKRGVEWNTGSDGTHSNDMIRIQQADLRTWQGDDIMKPPYHLITGTPPYFPLDSFVASQNHEQKVRCRIPTRGGASDYVRTASRLLKETDGQAKSSGGVFCMVEAAFGKASDAVQQTARECGMKIERRVDVTTREGLPPRFSCWVMTKPKNFQDNLDPFPIEHMTLRQADLSRTTEYSAAMECMGWVDFETHGEKSSTDSRE